MISKELLDHSLFLLKTPGGLPVNFCLRNRYLQLKRVWGLES